MVRISISVFIMAIVTYAIRFLPLGIIRKKIDSPFIQSFLYYIPYTVLAAMTFPTIFYSTGNVVSSIIGTSIAIILAYFEKSLITVTLIAVFTVYIVQCI